MKACTTLPWSSARIGQPRYRLLAYTQFNRRSSTERPQNYASPIVHDDTAAATHPSFDIDQENKTIATAVGLLPLSPVMDPSYWEATMRHQVPKQRKGKAQNSVERQFRKSPYAQALATPVRRCPASQTRLPSFFLQDFNFIAHPETGQPWWVPRSLAGEQPDDSQQVDTTTDELSTNAEEFHDEQSGSGIDGGEPDASEEDPSVGTPAAVQSEAAKPYGPSVFLLARQDLLSALSKEGVGFKNLTKRLLAGSSSRYNKLAGKAVWREDMDSFILNRMRHGIVENLLYLSRLCIEDSRYYIVKCHGWSDVQYKHKGSLLWFGDPPKASDAGESGAQPGPFATYDITNEGTSTSVAVHNMAMLLGTEVAANVREEAAVFADGSLFMLAGRRTTNLQLKLWKLQGYLFDYKKLP
ncbi:hypothetical protein FHL15_002842 [Xylaria flabelliformis]|uniref:Uncharacterized protein n=1 Tax=Xylaria flabelliformis TaxID=2512241 RepID=A0A553I7E8_9PEZI|nr:hypothetical protein FHL15_002842 [Xylaria flabelliformis]